MKKVNVPVLLLLLAHTAGISGQPAIEGIFHRDRTVGMFEKLEMNIQIEAEFENPYDPDELDITATFTSPSGKTWKVPGFYNQVYRGGFLVRFSADEKGEWTYTVSVTDKNGTATSDAGTFKVVSSEYHGPIRIAPNKRYLQHADGTSWYGVGLWYNGTETDVLDELKDRGLNFISHLITPLETRGTGLGRYDQRICHEIDELLENLEERDMQLALNFWFHSFLSETVWGEGWNQAWNTNPYQYVCDAKDFYSSEEAWVYQEKLYRYMIARWGYSRSLAIWFIVDEVNGTDGWARGDSLGAANWVRMVHEYFKAHDPWRHLTTGTRSGGIDEWWDRGYAVLDMAGREIYEAQGFPINMTGQIEKDPVHPLTHSYRNYHGEVNKLWTHFEKPAIIPETGWDHVFYEPEMPGYLALYHNALWVCLASGSAMSPFWWSYSWRLTDVLVTNQLRSYRWFTSHIPFAELTGLSTADAENPAGDAYAIKSDQMIFGWVVNADTDMAGKSFSIHNIEDGRYKLRLYRTWSGRFIPGRGQPDWTVVAVDGRLRIEIPVLKITNDNAHYIGQDIAFILEPAD